jgi:ketosteroid isomerase-like protein
MGAIVDEHSDASDAQQAVLQAQRHFWAALQRKDAQLFEQILANDFVSRSPGRPNQTRAALISTLSSFPASVLTVEADDLEIHVFGDVAVLTGVQVARLGLPDGNAATNKVMVTNIFRLRAGQWSMVLSHAVELPG